MFSTSRLRLLFQFPGCGVEALLCDLHLTRQLLQAEDALAVGHRKEQELNHGVQCG